MIETITIIKEKIFPLVYNTTPLNKIAIVATKHKTNAHTIVYLTNLLLLYLNNNLV